MRSAALSSPLLRICGLVLVMVTSAALHAQTRTATPQVSPEKATEVGDIQILHVRGGIYLLAGPGGNSTVQVGDEGVLVIDTMAQGTGESLVAAIRTLTPKPILQIINTSADADHIGGNEAVRKAGIYFATGNTRDVGGASIFAHEGVLIRASADGSPVPKAAWPTDTYFVSQRDLFFNGEPVQMFHQPAAHSDGDSLVLFRRSDVLSTGDVFAPNAYPRLAAGGSINGLLTAINRVLEIAVPEFNEEGGTAIIPGHGRICDESDVSDYRDMVTIVRDRVLDLVKKKATLAQAKAARVTVDYDGVYESPAYTGDMFVEAVYRSLSESAKGTK